MRLASFGLGLGLAAALLLPFPATAAEPSFFDQGRAQAALEKIFDKAGHPSRVLRVVLHPNRLTAELQDPTNPNHVDSWADYLGADGKEAVTGPRPVELDLEGRGLDAKLFPLKPADLAVVAGLAAASVKEAKLEDAASVDRIELRRQEPSTGPPVWGVYINSGREHATVYADLDGTITHGDFRGTHRAQVIDYENAGPALDDVIKTVADTLGTAPVIKVINVYPKALGIDAVDPDHPDRYTGFRAGINGVYRAGSPVPDSPLEPPSGRFAINDVDWQLLPKLVDAARDRLRLPDGRISGISIKKPDNGVTGPTLRWQITIEDDSANGLVEFDAKGTVLHVLFPQGREPVFEMFDAASAAMVFEAANHLFGEHVSMLELRFEPHEALLALQDPKKPGGAVVFQYGPRGLSRSLVPTQDRPRTADWFFDFALVQPVAAQWRQLQQDTLTQLGLADGKIDRVTVSKLKSRLPQNDRVLIVVEASAGSRKGTVAYDLDGKVVDIVKP